MLEALQKGERSRHRRRLARQISKLTDQYATIEIAPNTEITCSARRYRNCCPRARSRRSDLAAPRPARSRSIPQVHLDESLSALEVHRHRRRRRCRPLLHAAEFLSGIAGGADLVEQGRVKVDTTVLQTVESALKAANITYYGAVLDTTGIKVRFADPDTQLKAKDVLQAKLDENYIVALNLLSSSPHWLTVIGALPMYLGLDLRGGVHFLLQVDMKAHSTRPPTATPPTSARCCAKRRFSTRASRARARTS
jgi:hypothetical protein